MGVAESVCPGICHSTLTYLPHPHGRALQTMWTVRPLSGGASWRMSRCSAARWRKQTLGRGSSYQHSLRAKGCPDHASHGVVMASSRMFRSCCAEYAVGVCHRLAALGRHHLLSYKCGQASPHAVGVVWRADRKAIACTL